MFRSFFYDRVADRRIYHSLARRLSGRGREGLRQHLVSAKSAKIDLRARERAHTAVIQVLSASEREVDGEAGSLFFAEFFGRQTSLGEPLPQGSG
jgi:hypothetical protein